MANMKRVPATESKKTTEQMKSKPKVKITGSASTTPRVSNSMIKSQPVTTSKAKPVKLTGSIAKVLKPIKPAPMTPQDAAMFKLLQKKYPDLYPKKSSPLNK